MTRAALRLECYRDRDDQRIAKPALVALSVCAGMASGWTAKNLDPKTRLPHAHAEGVHWFALYKPPFWEVSVTTSPHLEDDEAADEEDDRLLTNSRRQMKMQDWTRQHLEAHYPICKDASSGFGVMHRLDVQTSGVLLCAKSYVGAQWFKMQWCSHGVIKEYICLTHGWVVIRVTEVRKRIVKEVEKSNGKMSIHCFVSDSGKPAYTEVATLAHLIGSASSESGSEVGEEQYSLVALKLHTGRTHQIRVHMHALGHPLVCDIKYAAEHFPTDCTWSARNFLHSYHLGCRDVPRDSNPGKATGLTKVGLHADIADDGSPGSLASRCFSPMAHAPSS